MKPIPAFRYHFPPAEIDRITGEIGAMLRGREFLTMGRHCEALEADFAAYAGASHALAVSGGTAALEIILRHIGVEGREVIVPTNTFTATAFAVLHAGGFPVFADCLEDLTVDPAAVERALSPRTAAIVTVHIGGLVSPATLELLDLARRKGLPLVEDCAHAHGSRLDGRHAGTFGVAGAFSFFTTKLMTAGEGGLIVTNDADLHQKARRLRDQGRVGGSPVAEEIGHNWRMTEMQAVLARSQLRTLDEAIEGRGRAAAVYDEAFVGHPALRPLARPAAARHNHYKYVVHLERGERDRIRDELKAEHGVSLGGAVYEVPCHRQPVFARWASGSFPVADRLCASHICPPIYADLGEDDARRVAEALRSVAA